MPIPPRTRAFWQFSLLIVLAVGLCVAFPRVLRFVEMAARELRYMWWLILIIGVACWLIWGVGRRPKV